MSGEFVRAGRVGGAEQAFGHWVTGCVTAALPGEVSAIGGPDRPVAVRRMPSPHRLPTRFATETASLWEIRRDFDVVFYPNYFTPWVPEAPPRVTAILDLQYLHHPQYFSRRKRVWLRFAHELTLRTAARVTTLSEYVRGDMIERYGSRADRVEVLPVPIDFASFGELAAPARRPFILGVAGHYQHKNLATLIRAFTRVAPKWPDVDLVLVGQLGRNLMGVRQAEDVEGLVKELGVGDRVETTGYIEADRLGALYRSAEMFVFPSIFEGFGMPPVEALGFGLPVITTRRTAIPEVTLGLAEYVGDPFDERELADRIDAQLSNRQPPSDSSVALIRETYSVERVGRQLYSILSSAAQDV